MEKVHNISEVSLMHDARKDIDAHQCLIEVIELYSDRIAVHLDASKERLLEEYQKKYELEELPCVRVNRPLSSSTSTAPPPYQPVSSKNYEERTRRLLNERAAADASTNDTTMAVVKRPDETEPPPHPDTFVDSAFYIKLKATLEVVFVSVWGVFMQQYQFNKLDNRMSKLEKGQNVTKSVEETAVELDTKMSMDAELIGKFITQQVAAMMAERKKQYENKNKKLERGEKDGVSRESDNNGTWGGGRASKKRKINNSDDLKVKNAQEICLSICTRPKDHPSEPLEGKNPKSRRC